MSLSALLHPVPIALGLLVIVFLAAALIQGGFGTRRDEAKFGLMRLCELRWNDFARIVGAALKNQRGMAVGGVDRSPGKGGFDLLFQRGASTYLVQCKNSAIQRVSAQMVGELNSLMQSNEADGAIIASCGIADPKAMDLAQERRIDVIAGPNLWFFLKDEVPHDVREESEAHAQRRRMVRLGISGGLALVAALLCLTLWPSPPPPAAPVAPVAARSAPAANAAAREAAAALPDASLTEDQLRSRRANVEMEVRSNPNIAVAAWQTKSTLLLRLNTALDETALEALVRDACEVLLQREELRYTRLQLEIPTNLPDQPYVARWRQCR